MNTSAQAPAADPPPSPLLRREDARMLRGDGRFVDDIRLPGMLHARFVRSPHARALIRRVDVTAAAAVPGVVAAFTGADFAAVRMPSVNPLVDGLVLPERHPMAIGAVDYPGQALALVLAADAASARHAASLVTVDAAPVEAIADPGPERVDAGEAADGGDGGDGGVVEAGVEGRAGDGEGVFGLSFGAPQAPDDPDTVRVGCRLRQPRVAAVALEPRSIVVAVDPADRRLTVWIQSQSPSRTRTDIAAALGVDAERVRVIAPDVGGAFGAKASVFPDDLLICAAAHRLGRTVKWTATRSEEFVAGVHGRGASLRGSLALAPDGGFRSLDASLAFPLGGWLPFSATVPARNAARILPGPYRVASVHVRARGFASSAPAVNIYRGAGRPEAAILVETLVDRAARRLRIDPVELRRRNLLRATDLPWRTPTGETLDSGDYLATLEQACDAFGYDEARDRQRKRRACGEWVGIGVACYVEPCGQGWESARVTARADGRFVVASGSSAQGQGHETVFAQVAAAALGCDPAAIDVLQADTRDCPPGIGALASRSIAIGASAIDVACRRLAARIAGGERARADAPLEASVVYEARGEAWSHGCVIVQLRLEAGTGRPRVEALVWADDAGHIVNPVLAHGQLVGGLAQGVGQALLERLMIDEHGQLLTGSLMDYALPRATDVPVPTIVGRATPSPMNALGAKGVGEAGCIGVPAAILNAAADALAARPSGAPDDDELQFPLTPERLWRAMNGDRR
ncbi:MAG: xanthine dehydrogenase family protein molybdopterin-binding subunit [Lautropia sp.]